MGAKHKWNKNQVKKNCNDNFKLKSYKIGTQNKIQHQF